MDGQSGTRNVLSFVGNLGSSLPAVISRHLHNFYFKRAAGSETELYVGLKDSSGVSQLRRILTKTYGDTLYQPLGGSTITVQEGDSDVDTAVTTLDFDASDFNVTSSPSGEANIALAYGTTAGTPAEGNHTHTYTIAVQEEDTDVVAAASTLDFDGVNFDVSDDGSGEARIELAYPEIMRRPYKSVMANANATTWSTFGMSAPTITSGTAASNQDQTAFGAFIQLETTASSGNVASMVFANAGGRWRSGWDPAMEWAASTASTLTSIRIWMGAFSGAPSASADPAVHGYGFRFDTGASDTNYQAWCNDGSGGGTITDTQVAVNSTTTKFFKIVVSGDGTSIAYYINDTLVATHTTDLPTTTTYINGGLYVTTLTGSTRALRIGWVNAYYGR